MYVKCIVYGSRYFGSMQMYIIITWTRLSYIVILYHGSNLNILADTPIRVAKKFTNLYLHYNCLHQNISRLQ